MMFRLGILLTVLLALPTAGWSQVSITSSQQQNILVLLGILILALLVVTMRLLVQLITIRALSEKAPGDFALTGDYLQQCDRNLVNKLIDFRTSRSPDKKKIVSKRTVSSVLLLAFFIPLDSYAQSSADQSLFSQWGIIITMVLIALPLMFSIIFSVVKINRVLQTIRLRKNQEHAAALADYIQYSNDEEIDAALLNRRASLDYKAPSLIGSELIKPKDTRGILQSVDTETTVSLIPGKAKQNTYKERIPQGKLILWFLGSAIFWLVFGTTVGEYLGIKFLAPEADSISWLSFGRLRPVHTNAVFWGWSSLAMLGLAYYVIPKVSNTTIASIAKGWATLWLINASVVAGTLCLMAGINNGGGEYREYIWPVMLLFGVGLIISLINFLQTIARRRSSEIYISNWYIVAAMIFTVIIAFIAYWPTWQNGLGETIVQGYYMHQGVGMWFMLFTLGLVYYFLPQQLNKPIYSYGLGILAFWSQIIFYTVIGTHHFVFSSIPWWLQTVAIVGSAGMVIPVLAGTTNFYMTFRGAWKKMTSSYTLPFFFVGILFYFTGSLQGTAEAFRYTNLLWHFTDFTVAHSHLTMYGIIAFLLWGSMYVMVPRITGNEPSQSLTGIHFWMAFIGLMFYTIPLMIGGTMKGLAWMDGTIFTETITLMKPYWLWRAIGGTLMWISHLVFAFNFYKMVSTQRPLEVAALTIKKLNKEVSIAHA